MQISRYSLYIYIYMYIYTSSFTGGKYMIMWHQTSRKIKWKFEDGETTNTEKEKMEVEAPEEKEKEKEKDLSAAQSALEDEDAEDENLLPKKDKDAGREDGQLLLGLSLVLNSRLTAAP
jgi:hypothetical protein